MSLSVVLILGFLFNLGTSRNRRPQEPGATWNCQAWTSFNLTYYSRSNQHSTECWEGSWTWRERISCRLGWVSVYLQYIYSRYWFAAQLSDSKVMTCQLIGKDDSSFDDSEVLSGRWQFYVDAYVSVSDNSRFWRNWLESNGFCLGRKYRWCITGSR